MSIIDTLITDRTEADFDRAKALAAKGWDDMTDDEKAEWRANPKGAYNVSDLNRVTLPGSRSEQEHNIRALVRPDSPVMHLPDPLVRAYRLTATLPGGSEMLLADECENALRTVHIPVGKTVTSLTLTPLSTYGDTETVHLLSFDFR